MKNTNRSKIRGPERGTIAGLNLADFLSGIVRKWIIWEQRFLLRFPRSQTQASLPARQPEMPANTAIADAADFQHTEMPANTAIADFADVADFFRANDRGNAGTAQYAH